MPEIAMPFPQLDLQRQVAQIRAAHTAASHDRNTPPPGTVNGSRQSEANSANTCTPPRDVTPTVVDVGCSRESRQSSNGESRVDSKLRNHTTPTRPHRNSSVLSRMQLLAYKMKHCAWTLTQTWSVCRQADVFL